IFIQIEFSQYFLYILSGNLITIIALLRCPKLRKHATTYFVISLCISDLMFCTINLPFTASRYIYQAWVFSDFLCQLFPFFFYGNVGVSLLSMVAITINRYVLISYNTLYDKMYSKCSICAMLAFIWIFSFTMMAPPLFEVWGRLGLDPPTFSCTILKKNGTSPKKMLFVVGFLFPCLVIIISYSCIYWKVRQSRKKLQAHSPAIPRPSSMPSAQQYLHRSDDIRLTRLMLTIFCCYLMCFLPIMVMNVADDEIYYPTAHVLASILAWASSVVNPFIYAGSNRQYRDAYRGLFGCARVRHGDGSRRTAAAAGGEASDLQIFFSRYSPFVVPMFDNDIAIHRPHVLKSKLRYRHYQKTMLTLRKIFSDDDARPFQ
ncbi:Protein trapped in endoderm-1, partial [Blattella germanica]